MKTFKLPLKTKKFHYLVLLSSIFLFYSCQSPKVEEIEEPGANYTINLTSDVYWKIFPNNDQANTRIDASSKIRIDVPQKEVIIRQYADSIAYRIDSCNLSKDSILSIYTTIDEDLSAIITANCRDYNQRVVVQQHSRKYKGKNYDLQYKISRVNDEMLPKTDIEKSEHFHFFDIPMDCTAEEMAKRLQEQGFNYGYHSQKWTHLTGYIDDVLCNICIDETVKSRMAYMIRVELLRPFNNEDIVALINNLIINYGNFYSPYSWWMLKYEESRGYISIYERDGNLDIRIVDNIYEDLEYQEVKSK